MSQNDDLIRRQMAIDALDVLCQEHRYRIPGKRETYSQYNEAWQDALDRAEVAIGNLPSAQPATNCSEIPNGSDDTISRRAAIDALARMMPRSYTPDGSHPGDKEIFRAQEVFADCIEALEILPSAQPEIIRCKDCKHYLHDEEYGFDWCNRMSGVFRAKPDGFCSWAVMRGGGTE